MPDELPSSKIISYRMHWPVNVRQADLEMPAGIMNDVINPLAAPEAF